MTEIPECLKKLIENKYELAKDCIFFSIFENFYKLHRKYHQASPSEKPAIKKALNTLSDKISKLSEDIDCFPTFCHDCPGKKRCLNCKNKINCVKILAESDK